MTAQPSAEVPRQALSCARAYRPVQASPTPESQQVAREALDAVRAAAANWLTGVTALLGLFSISGVVFAGNNLGALTGGKLTAVGITLGAALVLAAAAICTGYTAAYGWPSTKNMTAGPNGTGVSLPSVFLFKKAVPVADLRTNIKRFHLDISRRTLQAVIALRVSVTCAMSALTALAITFYAICIFK